MPPLESDAPECLQCGTCCFSGLLEYVRVTGDDHERMGDRADSITHFDGNRVYMNMFEGHCAQLRLDVSTASFVCQVYEIRPQTCRDLTRHESACEGERIGKGERPPLALIALGKKALLAQ